MKKGFTLIELLAVIVILAIIALIAVPVVLNIINDSRKSSDLISAEMYLRAVEYSIANASLNNKNIKNGIYNITNDGNLCLETLSRGICLEENTLSVLAEGNKPNNGYIEIIDGNVRDISLFISNQKIVKDNTGKLVYGERNICNLDDTNGNREYDLGEIVTCGTESFYVIAQDTLSHKEANDSTVSLLGVYNLNVGDNRFPNENTYGMQDENVRGFNESSAVEYGNISFSNTTYWVKDDILIPEYDDGTRYPFVYNENSNIIYPVLEDYELSLKKLGIKNVSVTLPSVTQLKNTGCSTWGYCPFGIGESSFWTGSADIEQLGGWLWAYSNRGEDVSGALELDNFNSPEGEYGVKPVVIIDKTEIEIK